MRIERQTKSSFCRSPSTICAEHNHARLAGPRRALMQAWADMIGCWTRGETAREAIIRGKTKIDEAAHDTEGMGLQAKSKDRRTNSDGVQTVGIRWPTTAGAET